MVCVVPGSRPSNSMLDVLRIRKVDDDLKMSEKHRGGGGGVVRKVAEGGGPGNDFPGKHLPGDVLLCAWREGSRACSALSTTRRSQLQMGEYVLEPPQNSASSLRVNRRRRSISSSSSQDWTGLDWTGRIESQ
ncbi:hypothetical protein MARPO_0020s0085 [Marchantia polymorpha]|uniref:Uncharacterized protein n=1 Tax=Marchantia polymorpha TaxID=3197 RepID=A0A2R6XE97_MARPO|nr:hypothetical protein MARPO_0020s0085 [Marchantia polymorpha]|eukprot:PTQ44428.1 hypothetical protein MARPO_0020s0085 [Marchantia polymorpha]